MQRECIHKPGVRTKERPVTRNEVMGEVTKEDWCTWPGGTSESVTGSLSKLFPSPSRQRDLESVCTALSFKPASIDLPGEPLLVAIPTLGPVALYHGNVLSETTSNKPDSAKLYVLASVRRSSIVVVFQWS